MEQNNTITLTKTNKNNNLKSNLIPETMKTKMNFLKTAVMAIALMGTTQIFAQVIPGQFPTAPTGQITVPADLNGGLVTYDGVDDDADGTDEDFAALGGTVMFYRPTAGYTDASPEGSKVNLEATLDDNGTATGGIPFSSYLWYKVTYNSTTGVEDEGTPISGATTYQYSPTNLDPGYNKFRVRGETGSSVSSCPSDEYQDVIVFVLPELDVVPTVNGTELIYCASDVPPAGEITLTAAVTADYTGNNNDYPKPGLTNADADFALIYDWYAVPTGGGAAISLGTSATLDLSSTTNPLTPGTYEFYVDVEYDGAIRAKGSRTYVTYGESGNATIDHVVVTDTPGTPEITVVNVED